LRLKGCYKAVFAKYAMHAYLRSLFLSTDMWLSALTGGDSDQTISQRVAIAAANGSRPACMVCWWLSKTVEEDHCEKTLSETSTTPHAALLSAVQITTAFTVLVFLPAFLLGTRYGRHVGRQVKRKLIG
jgi:hypothetical protein